MPMEFNQGVKNVFQRRQAKLIQHLMSESLPLVNEIEGTRSAEALQQLDEDLGVLTGLFDSAVRNPGGLLSDLCDLLRTFSPYLNVRGLFEEQLHWAQSLLQYFKDHAASEEDAVDMSLLLVIAAMYHRLGEHEDALDIYNFVLSIDRHRATHPGFALTYHNMALVYLSRGDVSHALEACRRSLEIYTHNENSRGLAQGLMLLADLLEETGDIQGMAQALRQASEIPETFESHVLRAMFTGKLAVVAAKYHSAQRADSLFQEAITAWRELGDEEQLALAQFNYAVVLHEVGSVDEAHRLASESLRMLEAAHHFRAKHVRKAIEAWDSGEDAPRSIPQSS